MSNEKYTANITVDELNSLISNHAIKIANGDDTEHRIERLNYLNKRLKDIKAKETETPAAKAWGIPPKE